MTAQPWLDPELSAQQREPMHAITHPAAIDLDGEWRFQLLPQADAEPDAEWRDSHSRTPLHTITAKVA